jgi:hypothetical protein
MQNERSFAKANIAGRLNIGLVWMTPLELHNLCTLTLHITMSPSYSTHHAQEHSKTLHLAERFRSRKRSDIARNIQRILSQTELSGQDIQCVSKSMSQTFPGYSPPPLKQKKFLSTWVLKWTGSEISTYVHVLVPVWVLHKMFKVLTICRNTSVSRRRCAMRENVSAAWKSRIRKCFLIHTPCLMCIAVGTTVEEVDVCHLSKRVVFGLHHESNTINHFNCWVRPATTFTVPLSGHVTLLTLLTGYELLHTLPYAKRYS